MNSIASIVWCRTLYLIISVAHLCTMINNFLYLGLVDRLERQNCDDIRKLLRNVTTRIKHYYFVEEF